MGGRDGLDVFQTEGRASWCPTSGGPGWGAAPGSESKQHTSVYPGAQVPCESESRDQRLHRRARLLLGGANLLGDHLSEESKPGVPRILHLGVTPALQPSLLLFLLHHVGSPALLSHSLSPLCHQLPTAASPCRLVPLSNPAWTPRKGQLHCKLTRPQDGHHDIHHCLPGGHSLGSLPGSCPGPFVCA